MKRIITLLLTVSFISTFAQPNIMQNKVNVPSPNYAVSAKIKTNKTLTCTDTVYYPYSKLTGAPEAYKMYKGTALVDAVSQAYYFSNNGIVRGIRCYFLIDFDGVPNNMPPVRVTIKVATINADNTPGSTLDSSFAYIQDVGFNYQNLMFDNPISVSDSFALIVAMEDSSLTTDTLYYTTNTSANNDGQQEKLSSVRAPGFGGWFNAYTGFGGWDMDIFLFPIFEQSISAGFISDSTNICPGDTIYFSNTSFVNRDRMFNRYASLNLPLYLWDFKDGATSNAIDTSHAFINPGNYAVTLKTYNYGWTVTCIDSSIDVITVNSPPVANFSFTNNNGLVDFSNTSTIQYGTITSWMWNFGDGNISNLQNPQHQYATNGSYTACLTVSDNLGCFTDDTCKQVLINTGVSEYINAKNFKLYPIPARIKLQVTVPKEIDEGYLEINNIVGASVKKIKFYKNNNVDVWVDELDNGVYFITLQNADNQTLFTKRFIVEH
jgi:hypothetical protein